MTRFKPLAVVLATIAAACVLGVAAEGAGAKVFFSDGSAADAVGRCHSESKGVTYRVDNLGAKPLFYRVIAQNLDDNSREGGPWERLAPRASHANIIQLSTFLEPAHRYRLYLQYARFIGGKWQYRVDWIRGIGVCVL
jgi:hypothetical protein